MRGRQDHEAILSIDISIRTVRIDAEETRSRVEGTRAPADSVGSRGGDKSEGVTCKVALEEYIEIKNKRKR